MALSLISTLGTNRLIALFALREWDGNGVVSMG